MGGNDAKQGSAEYERVGFASVPDHYEPDDEEEEEEEPVIKKKEDTEKMAEANKAFAHFRW